MSLKQSRLSAPEASSGLRVFEPESQDVRCAERIALGEPGATAGRQLIAHSEALRDVIRKAKQVARSKVPVLVQGESGTGKELLARLIHESSPRQNKPFVQVNCAAFSETLVESELFGHEKGAFTGAEQRHRGYFERAATGSLLLDEIGEMPLTLQARLLRVLEEETFDRVGGEQPVRFDVRLIATTNRDLEQEVAQGHFRRDLFYRLQCDAAGDAGRSNLALYDIPPLVEYFIEKYGDQGQTNVTAIAPQAMQFLLTYSWPGNIRQLRNVIHHACVPSRKAKAASSRAICRPCKNPARGKRGAELRTDAGRDRTPNDSEHTANRRRQ